MKESRIQTIVGDVVYQVFEVIAVLLVLLNYEELKGDQLSTHWETARQKKIEIAPSQRRSLHFSP